MLRATLAQLGRVRVTLAYGGMLLVVTFALSTLDPDAQEAVFEKASTNLHNLAHWHLGTLLGSAFVVDAGAIALWLPNLLCLLALAELLWGSSRLVIVFLVGHVGATLVVAAGLVAEVTEGWASTDVIRATDVGVSYGAMAVLGALTPAIPRAWRPVWIGWWLGLGVAVVGAGGDFTDVGHCLALLLGMLVATRFGSPEGWTRWRLGMLAVSAWFGCAMVVSTTEALPPAAAGGVLGAVAGGVLIRSAARGESWPTRSVAVRATARSAAPDH